MLTCNSPQPILTRPRRWVLTRADWNVFRSSLTLPQLTECIEESITDITHAIVDAAEKSIPLTGGVIRKRSVPWWNEEVKNAIQEKKRCFNRYKRQPSVEALIQFKRARAVARQVMLRSKRTSWNMYVSMA